MGRLKMNSKTFFYKKVWWAYNICRVENNEKGYVALWQVDTEEQAIETVSRLNSEDEPNQENI